nr:hypothetical protein [Nanoarchaeota archaeon]
MPVTSIPSDKYFKVVDGTVIRHLAELPDALRNMNPETFASHVNNERNDFYDWVKDVFNHSTLARKIRNVKRKETMAKKVFSEIFS